VRVETVCVQAEGVYLTIALETVLAQRGYRTLRTFDQVINSVVNEKRDCCMCGVSDPGACRCRYTVLFAYSSQETDDAEILAIQGRNNHSVVTLLSHDDSKLAVQFASLLIEVCKVCNACQSPERKFEPPTSTYISPQA
jgi:hypothetical protein